MSRFFSFFPKNLERNSRMVTIFGSAKKVHFNQKFVGMKITVLISWN